MSPAPDRTGETVVGLWIATLAIIWLSLIVSVLVDSLVAGALVGIAAGVILAGIGGIIIERAQNRKQAAADAQIEKLERLAQAVREQATADKTAASEGGAAWGSPGQ